MKRLTYFDGGKWRLKIGDTEYSGEAADRLAAYEGTGLEPEDIKNILDRYKVFRSAISDETGQPMVSWTRAGELCRADRDGRCVVLPCKENDTVFYLTGKPTLKAGQSFDRVEEGKVDGFYWDRRGVQIRIRNPKGNHGTYGFFGETVYTDKRAAEAALKGGSDGI